MQKCYVGVLMPKTFSFKGVGVSFEGKPSNTSHG